MPDLTRALALEEPGERVRAVLTLVQPSLRRQAPMSAKILHDRRILPALDALLTHTRDAGIDELTKTLAAGFAVAGATATRLQAAIALAVDFWTWQRLTQEGLADRQASKLMADLVACVAAAPNET